MSLIGRRRGRPRENEGQELQDFHPRKENLDEENLQELQERLQEFEEVEFPPRRQHSFTFNPSNVPICRRSPVTLEEFAAFCDSDGRLVDEHRFRQAVFRGGVEPSIRKQVWQFLFSLYPLHSTETERQILMAQHCSNYRALKKRWKMLLKEDEDNHLCNAVYKDHSTENTLDVENGVEVDGPCLSDNQSPGVQQRCAFTDMQAEVYAGRQPVEMKILKSAIRIVDKDVPRTDRDHSYFSGEGNPHLNILRDILITYAAYHPEVNYAQGMNDLVSRFLIVLDSEVEAYWCFNNFMESIHFDFEEEGILKKLELVQQLLKELDPDLYEYLEQLEVGDMAFCHRWMLLGFKREFSYDDSLRLFEILSSHHLELSSMEAEKVWDKLRRKDFANNEGTSRLEDIPVNTKYTFDVFMCVTILIEHRDKIFKCCDTADVFQFITGLTMNMDLEEALVKSEVLFFQYCQKSVVDCFEMVEMPIPELPPEYPKVHRKRQGRKTAS